MFEEYADIVTIETMCQMLLIGKSAAYELLKSGEIKSIRNGNRWLIPKLAIEEYVKKVWAK